MFGKSVKLGVDVAAMELELKHLREENQRLAYSVAAHEERITKEFHNASFAINWHSMEPFSIERMLSAGVQKTVIGYCDRDNQIKEWSLYCSAKQHEKLVEEFRQYTKEYDEQLQEPRLGGV